MNEQTKINDESIEWGDTALWFKAVHLKTNPAMAVCVGVQAREVEEGKKIIILKIEYDKVIYDFSLNKSNSLIARKYAPKSPLQLVGKKIYFQTVKVQNPTSKTVVDSLSILKVE